MIPLGIALSIRLIPTEVLEECRQKAQTAFKDSNPVSRTGAIVIIMIWVMLAALAIRWLLAQTVGTST